jgi:hypothetical protein
MKYYESHPQVSNTNASAPHGRGWFNVSSPVRNTQLSLWELERFHTGNRRFTKTGSGRT